MPEPISPELLDQFIAIVGAQHTLGTSDDQTHYTHENRGYVIGQTPLVLKPKSTSEVAEILKLANVTGTTIAPQGGHTGHAGGGVPLAENHSIVVSMERMNKVLELDLSANTLTVEAGMILENIQNLALENNRLFPLALGSQGSCMIGGNISTNAGGTGVLAFGNTRELVMGLEVVLANGEIWNGLNKLRKNNTGYDLKDLFIGAEGTLGIVTAAVLKLFPAPIGKEVAWAGFSSPENALKFLDLAKSKCGNQLTAFELVPRRGIEFLVKHFDVFNDPLETPFPWYGLIEISSGRSQDDARLLSEEIFSNALEENIVEDAVLASSIAQQKLFWKMREDLPNSQRPEGASIAHDISVPIGKVPELIRRGELLVQNIVPGARMVAFGHLGDGNIHFNFTKPVDMDDECYMEFREAVNQQIYGLVMELDGSFSAEHGIGLFKTDLMEQNKSAVELKMMRQLKDCFDPQGIMNPGKVLKMPV
ncbi:MAG: FAD-binding oxidoreductase [Hyphomicrobiales bacterium]|nr:FAD-binding oxidoreductase [Hyphomicrobiales bacterium]